MSAITTFPSGSPFAAVGTRTASPVRILVDRPARARLRLTARGRVVLLLLVAVPVALWLLIAQLNGGSAQGTFAGAGAASTVPVVVVQPGDSLWAVAERVAPTADPRDVIAAIVAFNHLASVDVMAGQQLGIPAPYAG